MIRVTRPAQEPVGLAAARAAALLQLAPHGPTTRKDLPSTYKVAHDALWRAQHFKCAYCETREQSKRNDVEHFRPATRANRAPGSVATHGYWWLAYTWENLLFACRNCNQAPYKLDKFPLESGSIALVPSQVPPGGEIPLLIDPASESPCNHIEFVADHSSSKVRWVPRARAGSRRGDETIRTCGLDRTDLVDLYTFHAEDTLRKDRGRVAGALQTGDLPTIQLVFQDFVDRNLAPSAVFAGLARDVLAHDVPATVRSTFALTLPSM